MNFSSRKQACERLQVQIRERLGRPLCLYLEKIERSRKMIINTKECIVYDVEIAKEVESVPGKWDNPEGMGFASAVAYDYNQDQYFFFLHEGGKKRLLDLLQGKIAVTFNGVKFDSRVILGNTRSAHPFRIWDGYKTHETGLMQIQQGNAGIEDHWRDYDILLKYIQSRFEYQNVKQAEERLGDKTIHDGSFGLDGLAEGTFGLHKTGHGAKAPILYQQEKYSELLEYNLHDVRLTKKLFDFIQQYGFIIDRNGRVIRIS